ncbi:hypothetical protein AALO_G00241630 [Alosa alosa]|uniref:C2H2-type domain-containing protein n=1 Tax=Alosa alosa TaxID=278164 RepID=A0AAV6FRA2_9TELE|nr:zinc finger protein 395a [Alosa alosa]XP_048126853.1 zinc finger protein 395a [Alosa alosa]KAG5265368.1 hypothetical protein AALO_G00241630 [Alosa alosa]
MLPKSRLGKRSTMGALVCGSCHPSDGHQEAPQLPPHQHQGEAEAGTPCLGLGPRPHGVIRVKLHPGQKVYVFCGGQECCGMVEQHNHVDNQVNIFLPQLNQHIVRKQEDVWTTPNPPLASHSHPTRSVSSCIDVPRSYRSPVSVDMDEMMAAMVLTSLSCSPLVQSPSQVEPAVSGVECGGGELSDSGSSGYWSSDHGNTSPAPSPTIEETDRGAVPPTDEGLDMELEQVLFDEPAPRKRKNSVKIAYRCLWRNCGKVLTSVVGMKRHIRTLHLGQSTEHERSQREEDFYYTEIYQDVDQMTVSSGGPPLAPAPTPARPSCASPSSTAQHIPSPPKTEPSPLSRSAPSESFWQVHCEHSYQAPAPPPAQAVTAAPSTSPSCLWTQPLTVATNKQVAPFRNRSVSVGEQWLQNHSAPSRSVPASVSPPRNHCNTRKIRGEAKKCRKVYGIEHRDQWCTACRWKKACQRFVD